MYTYKHTHTHTHTYIYTHAHSNTHTHAHTCTHTHTHPLTHTRTQDSPMVDKRAHHNALERRRRDHIKDSFHDLRDCIPSLQGEKVDTPPSSSIFSYLFPAFSLLSFPSFPSYSGPTELYTLQLSGQICMVPNACLYKPPPDVWTP